MPPKRCPECGRFLANDLVASLQTGPAPCPRCGIDLHPDTIVDGSRDRTGPTPARAKSTTAEVTGAADTTADATGAEATTAEATGAARATTASSAPTEDDSVRPPDLDPEAVRSAEVDDVLAGWDLGATAEEVAAWRDDVRPFPTDTVVVAVAALAGGVVGGLLPSVHRGRWAAVGVLGGAVGAGVARRIWELRG